MDKRIVILLFALMLISLVSAEPPQTFVNTNVGFSIEHPISNPIGANESHEFHFHVYNRSTGLPLVDPTTTCYFHLYLQNGSDIYTNDSVKNESLLDWKVYVAGSNFSKVGQYAFLFQCNNSILGGFYAHNFEVVTSTYALDNYSLSTGKAIMYSSFLFLFLIMMIALVFLILKLPESNTVDEEGKMMSISWLKYLRGTGWFVEYILFIAMLYLINNLAYAFLSDGLFARTFFVLYQITFRFAPVVVIIWIVWIFAKIFQDKQFWNLINRGMFPQGKM